MSDAESWMELCEMYICDQDYAKAAFCCEELILQNPNNHIYFQRYAEIRYTQGGFEARRSLQFVDYNSCAPQKPLRFTKRPRHLSCRWRSFIDPDLSHPETVYVLMLNRTPTV